MDVLGAGGLILSDVAGVTLVDDTEGGVRLDAVGAVVVVSFCAVSNSVQSTPISFPSEAALL